jgi:serine phosphatase RsbU (regulator of sigma subunit)
LQEVESLSRQTLEQERLAQESALQNTLLERDNERQKAELEAARALQLSMLPQAAPRLPGIEVAFEMRTATEVGGDYYDFHLLHENDGNQGEGAATLTLVLGDATGHGMDAGLVVAATKGLFHAAAAYPDLGKVLRSMAKGLEGLQLKRRFMALTLMRLRGTELELFTAGMPPVLLMRSGCDQAEELSLEDPPLASIRDHRYRSLTVELSPGDTVLALTDGFPERRNPSDNSLGYSAAADLLAGRAEGPLGEVLQACFELADRWAMGAPRHDDETVLLLRRVGP